MFKTKILILGPVKSGKTTIANYLADAVENFVGDYRPTHGENIYMTTPFALNRHLILLIKGVL
jgi:adenylate kinase family enzyme